jgi:tRNA U34 2-thiouridine synthase MnmA/TrmU
MKALALLSGGLDSTLAIKLMLNQMVEVEALNFASPFCQCNHKGRCYSDEAARMFNIPLKTIHKGEDYLTVINHPKYGYGSGVNPCIDCRIYMMKKAWEYATKIGAKFIVTGEVLGQRPMSQHRRAMTTIEKEADLEGKVLRPLSAKLLPKTEAEKMGWVDRERLLGIKGRARKVQMKMAESNGITDYPCPAGGCLLTQKEFARRVRELFKNKSNIKMRDMLLLKIGRHLWQDGSHVIVGRNESENKQLMAARQPDDYYFEVKGYGSPITVLQGHKTNDAIRRAATLTARYSDATNAKVQVEYGNDAHIEKIAVNPPSA